MSTRSLPLAVVTWLIPAGILVQAGLAGRVVFVEPSLLGVHGAIGNGVLLLALVTASFIWAAGHPTHVAVLASLTVVGLVAQVGLGYAGRRAEVASAAHVPLGAALLALSAVVAVLVSQHTVRARRGSRADAGHRR